MAKRSRKRKAASSPHPTQAKLLDLLAHSRPAAVAQREQSWTVAAADELLEEFDAPPAAHAVELRRKAEAFEEGVAAALAIADEMERRARVGVRHWPGSAAARKAAGEGLPELERTFEGRQAPAPDQDVDSPSPED